MLNYTHNLICPNEISLAEGIKSLISVHYQHEMLTISYCYYWPLKPAGNLYSINFLEDLLTGTILSTLNN